jgi:hypothetical protein
MFVAAFEIPWAAATKSPERTKNLVAAHAVQSFSHTALETKTLGHWVIGMRFANGLPQSFRKRRTCYE